MKSIKEHWDHIFSNTEETKLGWYEKDTTQTFKLLDKVPDMEKNTVFIPGAGTSNIIEALLSMGCKLILNDISSEALNLVKDRIRKDTDNISFFCQDISQPFREPVPEIDVWIDRAVLHFLTDKNDIKGYFENLKKNLKVDGHAVFAEFSLMGATQCAGLTLHRYSLEELAENLGPSFNLVYHFDYTYINPFGNPRPYIYAMFKREK